MATDNYDGTEDYNERVMQDERAAARLDVAECSVCGESKPICCDNGYVDNEDGSRTHSDAVCVDCHDHPKSGTGIWDGKSVAGGTYERCE